MPENTPQTKPVKPLFHSYEEVLGHLNGLGLFHMDMGLDRMERAQKILQLEEPEFPIIQVVGTNGKGSTATFLQSIAMAHGLRVGLYTSPHFIAPEERIRLDLTELPRRAWPDLASRAVQAVPDLTYFELLTIMAAEAFKASSPDLAIFEAGLGGRHDATTALPAEMVCFTPIGMDHMNVLGPTIYDIAADKADALRQGVAMAVSAPQEETPWAILFNKVEDMGIPLCSVRKKGCSANVAGSMLWDSLPHELEACVRLPADADLGLKGPHQLANAQTAVLAWILLCMRHGWKTNRQTIVRGLASAFIPGRLQYVPSGILQGPLWLDGAHNAHGMEALAKAIKSMDSSKQPGAAVFSCLSDKEPQALSGLLKAAIGSAPVFVPTIHDNPRAAQGSELAAFIGRQAMAMPSLDQALKNAFLSAKGRPVLVCGSLYLLSEFFREYPQLLNHPRKVKKETPQPLLHP